MADRPAGTELRVDQAPRVRVLLVDDHEDTLDLFEVVLGQTYGVSTCGSAAEALEGLAVAAPDVLVLDIGMSPVDGVECLQAIRAVPGYEHTPAIALTGFARDVDRQAFLAAGFQAVVAKPVADPRDLIPLIDDLARGPDRCSAIGNAA
jgi:CheY-like chemotaxis protein